MLKKKKKGCRGRICRKEGFKSGMKERVCDEKLIITGAQPLVLRIAYFFVFFARLVEDSIGASAIRFPILSFS